MSDFQSIPDVTLSSNDKLPMVGLGTSKTESKKLEDAVKFAIECGYRHFDSAAIYQHETTLGDALSQSIADRKVTRSELFLTSKVGIHHNEPSKVKRSLLEAFQKLKVDYLDLFYIHFPVGVKEKFESSTSYPFVDVDYVDTWKAMIELKEEGLVKNIGVSNFNQFQLNRIIKETSEVPAVNQIELHPYHTQTDLVDFCHKHGIAVVGHTPLGCGSYPYRKLEHFVLEDPVLKTIAARLNKTVAQVALRFQIQRNVCVIPKSVTPGRIKENFEVFGFSLTNEDMKMISSLNRDFIISDWNASEYYNGYDVRLHKYYPFRKNYTE